MQKTMLTYKVLDRFEENNSWIKKNEETIERAAYIANLNASGHSEWTPDDIYKEFKRILAIDHINVER